LLRVPFSRRAALLLGSGATLSSIAALNGLIQLPAEADAVPVGSRPVPAGAVIATPGNARSGLAKVPNGGTLVLRGGSYPEALGMITKNVTIQGYPGETAWFDGRGSLANAFIAGAKVNLYNVGVRNYSPATTGFRRAMVHYGGGSSGSVVQGCTFTGSKMASLDFGAPLTITGNTFSNNGWSGLIGTQSNGLAFTGNTITGMNRDNHPAQPETGGIKISRSANVLFKNNTFSDIPGCNGIWFDVSSTNVKIINNHVDGRGVGGRAAMKHAAQVELGEGGVVAGNTLAGAANAGLKLLDTGHVRVWNNDLRGDNTSLWLNQDARKNTGSDSANLSPSVAPWQALGNEVCNNTFGGGPHQLWAYDTGHHTYSGEDMLGRVAGNWFAPIPAWSQALRMGRRGSSTVDALTLAQLKAGLGSKWGGNYQGTSATEASKARVAVPSDIAALMK
jgi:hypothetical protein